MKDCVDCIKKKWIQKGNKALMYCPIIDMDFGVVESDKLAENCNEYERKENDK